MNSLIGVWSGGAARAAVGMMATTAMASAAMALVQRRGFELVFLGAIRNGMGASHIQAKLMN